MYKILLPAKPKNCENCPLKGMFTKDCGRIRARRFGSSGMRYGKEPDARCKIKLYEMDTHNG